MTTYAVTQPTRSPWSSPKYHRNIPPPVQPFVRNNVQEIPIDPALRAMSAECGPSSPLNDENLASQEFLVDSLPQPSPAPALLDQDQQAPRGDPFASEPAIPSHLTPTPAQLQEPERSSQTRANKKKNNPKKHPCYLCCEFLNRMDEQEEYIKCTECTREAHPSCLQINEILDFIHPATWRCVDCKICEICGDKGQDDKIMFCDHCDRGWHTYCVQPPMESVPAGIWHCSRCPAAPPQEETRRTKMDEPVVDSDTDSDRGSAAGIPTSLSRTRRKTRGVWDSKTHQYIEDSKHTPRAVSGDSTTLHAHRTYTKKKGRRSYTPSRDDGPPPSKRPRLRLHAPAQAQVPRIKIRVNNQTAILENPEREADNDYFEEVLSTEDRDTSKTRICNVDKQMFEKSRAAAELKLAPDSSPVDSPLFGLSGRPMRSSVAGTTSRSTPALSATPSTPTPYTHNLLSAGHHLRINTIRFGEWDIKTWYDAPFPEEYANIPDGRLWICEFCLKYMKSRFGAGRHRLKCKARHPPGDEIYRDGNISIFEVDGRKNKIYCQNLCLLSKMFLDHKSLFYDVEPFLFYVITESDDSGARFVGYFSKEKWSANHYNLSCIMTLPVHQRRGWGNLLIDFSYLLSQKEQRLGSPEKPLSALGALGYKNYWTLSLMRYLEIAPSRIRIEDVCAATSMTLEDAFNTLQQQGMITVRDNVPQSHSFAGQSIRYSRNRKQGVARRALHREKTKDKDPTQATPFTPPERYTIRWDPEDVDAYLRKWEAKGYLRVKPDKLKWSPFVSSRINQPLGQEQLDNDSSHLIANLKLTIPIEESLPSSDEEDQESQPSIRSSSSLPAFDEEDEEDDKATASYVEDEDEDEEEEEHEEHDDDGDESSEASSSTVRKFSRSRPLRKGRNSTRKAPLRRRSSRRMEVVEDSEPDRAALEDDDDATESILTSPPIRPQIRKSNSKKRIVESSPELEEDDAISSPSEQGISRSTILDVPKFKDTVQDTTSAAALMHNDVTQNVPLLMKTSSRAVPGFRREDSVPERGLQAQADGHLQTQPQLLAALSPSSTTAAHPQEGHEQDQDMAELNQPQQVDLLIDHCGSPEASRKSMARSDDTVFGTMGGDAKVEIEEMDEDADAEGEPDSEYENLQPG